MSNKFDDLCSLVLEGAIKTIIEAAKDITYGLSPEYNSDGLTGIDKSVADFVEAKPATISEIIEFIRSNSEDLSVSDIQNIIRDLVDSGVIVKNDTVDVTSDENEPNIEDLEKEPEVEVEPVVQPSDDIEQDEVEDTDSVPSPEVDADEENTFTPKLIKSRIEDIEDVDGVEDELDDTPSRDLLKREGERNVKRRKQLENMVNYIFKHRGRTPQEAQAYIKRAENQGLM